MPQDRTSTGKARKAGSRPENRKKNPSPRPVTARAAALRLLLRIEEGGYSSLLVRAALSEERMPDPAERALAERLVMGVTERRITLDYMIGRLSSRPLAKTDPDTRALLRLGIYQLAFCDRIPPHAAVNETVALARPSSRGFVNAILREYQRRTEDAPFPLPDGSEGEKLINSLSVRFSVPEPLCRELVRAYGADRTRAMLEAFARPAPLTLRVNTLRRSRESLLA